MNGRKTKQQQHQIEMGPLFTFGFYVLEIFYDSGICLKARRDPTYVSLSIHARAYTLSERVKDAYCAWKADFPLTPRPLLHKRDRHAAWLLSPGPSSPSLLWEPSSENGDDG